MALDDRGTTQKGHEASFGCFQRKGLLYKPHYIRNCRDQAIEINPGIAVDKGALVDEPNKELDNRNNDASTQCQQPVHPQNCFFWSAHQCNYRMEMPSHSPLLGSYLYPVSHDQYISMHNQLSYAPFQMHPQLYAQDCYTQDFHYFVVIDFEATCDKERNPHPQEIIEFPSVLVNSRTGKLEDSFQIYVRPTCNQLLSDFCRELTGIQQSQVDKGVILSEALLMHDKWLEEKGIKHTNFAVVTWSNWDCRVMLESECRFKRIRKPPYFNRWINLKVPFCEVFGGTRCNLKEAVQLAGLTWEGRAHCGLDDAKNTARLLTHLMHRGFKFAITNSLMWQTSDYTCTLQPIQNPEFTLAYQHPFKWKNPSFAFFPVQPGQAQAQTESIKQDHYTYCYCGVISMKRMVQKPGPNHGNFFFGCGKWTSTRGACCHFFKWVAAPESGKSI